MKSALLTLIWLAFTMEAVCAEKIRFTDTTNKWSMLFFTDDPAAQLARGHYTTDTIIAGALYHRLRVSPGTGAWNTLAVREDTIQGILYFRFITAIFSAASSTDTNEHILFDYRLDVGDTMKVDYAGYHFRDVVQSLDSVRLGADFYKRWVLSGYHFIEGVGTNFNPLFSAFPITTLSGHQLRCFTNQRVTPRCGPPIPLPFWTFKPNYPWEPFAAKYFDNDSSCTLTYLPPSVVTTFQYQPSLLSPNPGGNEICLTIPASMGIASLVISDLQGRRSMFQLEDGITTFPIGRHLSAPGLYFYTLQDAATGRRYTGRFIFR